MRYQPETDNCRTLEELVEETWEWIANCPPAEPATQVWCPALLSYVEVVA